MRGRPTSEDKMIENLIKESQASTSSSLHLLHDSKQIGQATLKELQAQGKQLNHTQGGVDRILIEEEESKKKLRTLSSIFGSLINKLIAFFSRKAKPKQNEDRRYYQRLSTTKINDQINSSSVTFQNLSKQDENNLKKNDKDLDVMLDEVKELNVIANQVHLELKAQNPILNNLSATTYNANTKAEKLNDKVRFLIP